MRCFAALALAGVAFAAFAQAPAPMTVGILSSGTYDGRGSLDRALVEGLREQGYVEGRNLTIVRRYESGPTNASVLAGELAGMKLDAILTTCTPSTRAMQEATGSIPIVMAAVSDPVRQGIIASLAKPGRNVTGTVSLDEELVVKRIELIVAIVPHATTLAVLANGRNPSHALAWPGVERAARALKMTAIRHDVATAGMIPAAMAAAAGASALLVLPDDPLLLNARAEIVRLAAHHRIPAFYWAREFVDAGGLASYGQSLVASYRSAGAYMARIKQGANPGQMPVEQPTRFEMVINLRAAQALDLAIPQSVLVAADDLLR